MAGSVGVGGGGGGYRRDHEWTVAGGWGREQLEVVEEKKRLGQLKVT